MAKAAKVTKPTLEQVKEAILIILDDTASYTTSLNWAVNYCKHAMTVEDDYEMDMQARYVLNNLSSWRHPKAAEVRAVLKAYIK
jgi:hypothetical protein